MLVTHAAVATAKPMIANFMESFLTVAGALAPKTDGAAEGAELDPGAARPQAEFEVLGTRHARPRLKLDLVVRLEIAVESFDRDRRVGRARYRHRHVARVRGELVAAAVGQAAVVAHFTTHDLRGHVAA